MKTALTIAGSDSSGGAGIQADIKTMIMNGVYGMSAITALTAQNTTGVTSIMEVTPTFLSEQLDSIFTDIPPDAVKIGMIGSEALMETLTERLIWYKANNIVVDPVMVSTSGTRLIADEGIYVRQKVLMAKARVITPNIFEAEILSELSINNESDMVKATEVIGKRFNCAVLCKGGHGTKDADDLLYKDGEFIWFKGKRIANTNTHGTGCTLSSAIAANLANGMSLCLAIESAKLYLTKALSAMLDLGKGSGPIDHGFSVSHVYMENL